MARCLAPVGRDSDADRLREHVRGPHDGAPGVSSVRRYLDAHRGRLAALLAELIRIPTVNPPGRHYEDIAELLARRCRSLGMAVETHRVPDSLTERRTGLSVYPRLSVVAHWRVGGARTLHFNAHYDVVPGMGPWRSGDPFVPVVTDRWVVGRGAADMKGSIAAWLLAVEALRETSTQPALDVECSFTPDEETGGELGAGYLVRSGLVGAEYALVGEGGSGNEVGCGHNGVLWMRVAVQGRAAHASRPEQGVNAFDGMAELVHALRGYRRTLRAARRRYRDPGGELRAPTVTLGGEFGGSAGDKINTVPAFASFSIDRRIVPNEQPEAVERELRQALLAAKRRLRVRCRSAVVLRIDPCVVEPEAPLPAAFATAVRAVRRRTARARIASGFTDLHYFVEELGIHGIGYGVRGLGAHGAHERVEIDELVRTAQVYAAFLQRGVQASEADHGS